MKSPAKYALTVRKGETFHKRFRWKSAPSSNATPAGVDLSTGWRARCQWRLNGRTVITFDSSPRVARDGRITLHHDGTIECFASSDMIAAINAGVGAWNLELIPASGGDHVILLEGRLTVLEAITR